MRESLARPGYAGDDYNVNRYQIENREKDRRCTDCIFIIVFFAFIAVFSFIGIHGYKNENYKELLAPIDADLQYCGMNDRTDFPYAYYAAQLIFVPGEGITYPLTPLCVKECPLADDPVDCFPAGGLTFDDCQKFAGDPDVATAHYGYATLPFLG